MLYLSKFEYNNINGWSEGCSPADHWGFYYPLRKEDYMNFEMKGKYKVATPKDEKCAKAYWGLKKVTSKTIDLLEVTSDNLQEKIFGEFDKLAELEY